ncbi:uncharacterized protein BDR25DRAFT_350269 [Lindgomyces ingoldianus]|uniref:Uncharacterized protein n=1 Tax=Lindgomyces ingoldianus TaxID=673940 RepID=A0ACB6R9R2_9PLEO|nr:uncharacterized protein BDR25DRAFT_350269 [Lindgomyces ingoldianus]KAF2475989.1 hypothetical protein BDR25DRAFT_350269 [Lindgomyces ingoldianus]
MAVSTPLLQEEEPSPLEALSPRGPFVQGIEDLYGSRWRQKHSEQVLYGRKVIINEIRRRQAQGMSTVAAVEGVESIRQRAKLSLYQLYQLLNK